MYRKRIITRRGVLTTSLLLVIFVMSLGYAALSQYIEIEGMAIIDRSWIINITEVSSSVTGTGANKSTNHVGTTVTLNASIPTSTSAVTYTIKLENKGNLKAIFHSVEQIEDKNADITYTMSGVEEGVTTLDPGESNTVTVTVKAKGTNITNTEKSIMLSFNYVENTKANEGSSNPGTYGEYLVGEKLELIDGSTWYVVKESGINEEYVTLLSMDSYGSYAFDTSGSTMYDPNKSTNVGNVIDKTIIPNIKSAIDNNGGDSTGTTGRLLTLAEYEQLKMRNKGIGLEETWLMSESDSTNAHYYNGSITTKVATASGVVRPVIITLKSNIKGYSESTLIAGQPFSVSIKNLANGTTDATYKSTDTKITYIGFYEGKLPEGYTISTFKNLPGVSVSTDNKTKAYHDNGKIYIYSDRNIVAGTDMYSMFRGTTKVTNIDLLELDTRNVTRMQSVFHDMNSLTSIDVSAFNTSKVTNMKFMFENCSSLTNLDVSSFNTSKVTTMEAMFYGCNRLISVDLSNFDTSNVTNMSHMFSDCSSLTNLDLSNFDTSKVTNMPYMFSNCSSLTNLDLSNFDTSNVTNMSYMFYGCNRLISVDLSNFDTSKVTNMSYMFRKCNVLTSLNLNSFNTSKVTNMENMFSDCSSLTNLDLSNFDTSKVTTMYAMFCNAGSLVALDLSSFNTSSVTNMVYMFYGMNSLKTIYVGNSWETSAVTNSTNMFYECSKLVGGNGTKYNASYTDKTYARVDTESTPGYFTLKNN